MGKRKTECKFQEEDILDFYPSDSEKKLLAKKPKTNTPVCEDFFTLCIVGLPQEIRFHVLSFLDGKELSLLSRVSKIWNNFSNNLQLWEQLCKRQQELLGKTAIPLSKAFLLANNDWKKLYKERFLFLSPKKCSLCFKPNPLKPSISLELSLCWDCSKDQFVTRQELKETFILSVSDIESNKGLVYIRVGSLEVITALEYLIQEGDVEAVAILFKYGSWEIFNRKKKKLELKKKKVEEFQKENEGKLNSAMKKEGIDFSKPEGSKLNSTYKQTLKKYTKFITMGEDHVSIEEVLLQIRFYNATKYLNRVLEGQGKSIQSLPTNTKKQIMDIIKKLGLEKNAKVQLLNLAVNLSLK